MPRTALLIVTLALAGVAPSVASAAYSVTGPASVAETAGTVTYNVNRGILDPTEATVTVSGSGPTPATAGEDHGAPNPARITFSGLSQTIQVPVLDDRADEPDEAFTVTVTSADGSMTGAAPTTIIDDDVTVDAAPAAVTEGGIAAVVLTPSAAATREVRVDYATVAGSAGGADFAPAQGTVTWPAGDRSPKTIAVPTTQDALDEADETVGLLLASTTDTVVPAVALTITDDDAPPVVAAAAAKPKEGDNGTKVVQVAVTLAQPSGRVVRVPYRTRDGTARAPEDYSAVIGTLTFNPGETSKTVTLNIEGDVIPETDERFTLALGPPENAALGAGGGSTTITIADDDDASPPRLTLTRLRATTTGVTVAVNCPAAETSCRGRLTLFTVPNRRSPVPALRSERRLGRATYRLKGKATRRVTLRLTAADRRLLRRARSIRVRAFAITTDADGNVANTSRSATLRFG